MKANKRNRKSASKSPIKEDQINTNENEQNIDSKEKNNTSDKKKTNKKLSSNYRELMTNENDRPPIDTKSRTLKVKKESVKKTVEFNDNIDISDISNIHNDKDQEPMKYTNNDIKECFKFFANGNYVNVDELKKLLISTGDCMNEDEVNEIFKIYFKNNNEVNKDDDEDVENVQEVNGDNNKFNYKKFMSFWENV